MLEPCYPDLRLGKWQDALTDVESCDALICDPPYSERTHKSQDYGARFTNGGHWESGRGRYKTRPRTAIPYDFITPTDVADFVASWAPRCAGWFVAFSDSELCPAWRDAFETRGLTGFQPIPCVIPGMSVRLAGDGPSSWAVYANVARPKRLHKWGTLPRRVCLQAG